MRERVLFLYIVSLAGVVLSFVLHGGAEASGFTWGSAAFLPWIGSDPARMIIAFLAAVVLCSIALLLGLINRNAVGWLSEGAGLAVVLLALGSASLIMAGAVSVAILGSSKWKFRTIVWLVIAVCVLWVLLFLPSYFFWSGLMVIIAAALLVGFSLYVLRFMEKLAKAEQAAEINATRAEDVWELLGSQRRMVKSTEHVSRLEERNRLAARIHDEIGHGMSGSILLLEGADLVMDKDPEKARETIRKVTENLRESVEEIRRVLHEERSAGAEINLARIENELTAFETDHPQVRTRLVKEGDMGSVSSAVWACIYENMIEALTNVLKHSAATLFHVSLKNSGGLLHVEFADNGGAQKNARSGTKRTVPGVSDHDTKRTVPGVSEGRPGIGLQNMEERAALCYGRCFFRHEPDGFHIVMTFPRRDSI